MQIYVKFFGRKAGALGISYWHTATVELNDARNYDNIVSAIYKAGFENVKLYECSVENPIVLTNDEVLFNNSNGLVRPII